MNSRAHKHGSAECNKKNIYLCNTFFAFRLDSKVTNNGEKGRKYKSVDK